jgi:alpha-beta hydrolase superfamily lysophospholipase
MGGNLVLHRLLEGDLPDSVRCVVAGSPWLTLHAPPGAMTAAIARLLTKIAPDFTAKNNLDIDDLTRSEAVRAETRADADYHHDVGARLYEEISAAGRTLLANASRIGSGKPLLVMVGTSDRIVSHESVLAFIETCGGRCESKVWEGFYHELHNEPEADEVLGTVADFLARRMPIPAPAEA